MSEFKFLVGVTTERESGLIASRDDQSQKIEEAILEALESVDISDIGARSDSVYAVTSQDVWELDKRDEKEMRAEYEERVRAEEPDDKTLRRELKQAKDDTKHWKDMFERQKKITDQLLEDPSLKPTKVYQRKSGDRDAPAIYLADGRYDSVTFQYGADRHDGSYDVALIGEGELEIRSQSMGDQLVVIPWSGNVVRLKVLSSRPTTRRSQ